MKALFAIVTALGLMAIIAWGGWTLVDLLAPPPPSVAGPAPVAPPADLAPIAPAPTPLDQLEDEMPDPQSPDDVGSPPWPTGEVTPVRKAPSPAVVKTIKLKRADETSPRDLVGRGLGQ